MKTMTDQTSYIRSSSKISDSDCKDNISKYSDISDDAVAKQFYSLPFQDRNDIYEEIHGVQSLASEETPELNDGSLRQLAIELENLPSRYKNIYQRALSMRTDNSNVSISNNNNKNGDFENLVEDIDTENGDDLFSTEDIPPSSNVSPCYVKSRNFQLAFLRCEFFDAKKAALRLAMYLELACDLYGEEALRRPLRVDDFKSKEEIEVLKAAHQQLLPFRDRTGRRVLALHGDLSLPSSSLMARSVLSKGPAMKVLLYLWSVLIEDVEAQRKGLVIIFWPRYMDLQTTEERYPEEDIEATPVPKKSRRKKRKARKFKHGNDDDRTDVSTLVPDADSRSTGIRFFEAVPVRVCALHICLLDTPFNRMIRHVLLFVLGENYRTRVKTHYGVGMEVIYSLMGYGIPVDTLPLDEVTQTIKTKNSASFIKVRRKIEAEQPDFYRSTSNSSNSAISDCISSDGSVTSDTSNRSSLIECPSLNDVIFRSGKSYMSHPGNMMFRELIEHHINEHNVATQDRKKSLTWQVIDEVEIKGGRFLEYDRGLGTWTELSDRAIIRHKIATYFKEFRRKMKVFRLAQTTEYSIRGFESQDGVKKRRKKSSNCLPETCFSNL